MNETLRNILHTVIGFFLFPVTVLGVIPGILIDRYGYRLPHPYDVGYWFAKVLLPGGVVMILWAVILFFLFGNGSPVPWAPPKRFVVIGPYRFVRNPMMIGILMMLMGEALIISSISIAMWWAVLFVLMNIGLIFIEEPGLEKRFGDNYRLYKANVGRWIPRMSGWVPPWEPVEPTLEDLQAKHWEGYTANQGTGDAEPDDAKPDHTDTDGTPKS